MGYYVRLIHGKKKSPNWKIQFVSTKLADRRESSRAKNPKRTWDIPKERWAVLGFHAAMSYEEAKARSKQINSQILLKQQEERLRVFEEKQKNFRLIHEAALCDEFVAEFEERFIRTRDVFPNTQRIQRTRQRQVTWRAAQKIIVAVGIEPTNWFYHPGQFYDLFYQKQYSVGYMRRVLGMINLWGHFICRKLAQPFLPIPAPRGYERSRLIEAYYKNNSPKRRPSEPITNEKLILVKDVLNQANFYWLHLSVWFGLRPHEIDLLHDNKFWKTETLPTGRELL